MRSLVLLLGASLALWAALLYPGWLWWQELALIQSTVAWALCVLPGAAAMVWATQREQTPEARVVAVLGGSGIRLLAALGGGLVLTEFFPATFTKIFWLWVGVFYLALLTIEVLVLVRHQQDCSVPKSSEALKSPETSR